jgi:hypothetical protein
LQRQFSSVEGLAWYKNRLFSCGTHGHVVEYDLEQEKIKASELFVLLQQMKLIELNFRNGPV